MTNALESVIGSGMMQLAGDPNLAGIGIVAFFTAAVFLWPASPPLRAFAIAGGLLLAVPFLSFAFVLLGFGFGVVVWFALKRMFSGG